MAAHGYGSGGENDLHVLVQDVADFLLKICRVIINGAGVGDGNAIGV